MGRHAPRELGTLGENVLALYSRAIELGQLEVGEHLLQALEALSKNSPDCEDCRDRAYLEIARQRSSS